MASEDPIDRIDRLTTGVVLQTLAGCRARLALLSLGERAILCRRFGVDDWMDDRRLSRCLHRPVRLRRQRRPKQDGPQRAQRTQRRRRG